MSDELLSLAVRALRDEVNGKSDHARDTEALIVERSGQGARTFGFPARLGLAALLVGTTVWAGGGGIAQFASELSERFQGDADQAVADQGAAAPRKNTANAPLAALPEAGAASVPPAETDGVDEHEAGREHGAGPEPSSVMVSKGWSEASSRRGSSASVEGAAAVERRVGAGLPIEAHAHPREKQRVAGSEQTAPVVASAVGARSESADGASGTSLGEATSQGVTQDSIGSSAQELDAYGRAHRLHFVVGDFTGALAGWNAYLGKYPHGTLALEARFNRALCLVRLGQNTRARLELEPFANGSFGSYRRAESQRLIEQLR